jgi:hypothetical protein
VALTDHFLPMRQLEQIARDIKNGQQLVLDDATRQSMLARLGRIEVMVGRGLGSKPNTQRAREHTSWWERLLNLKAN